MKTWLSTILAIACAVVAGCIFPPLDDDDHLHGSGVLAAEQRIVDQFEQIEVANGINAEIEIDESADGPIALTVSGDDNLLSYIETEVVGAVLYVDVSTSAMLDSEHPLEVSASVPALVRASLTNGASLEANYLDSWSFVLDVDNGAAAALTGRVDLLDATADNGALAWARYLDARRATIMVSNGAELEVCASELVEGEVSSGGHAELFCDPEDVEVDVTSGGTLAN